MIWLALDANDLSGIGLSRLSWKLAICSSSSSSCHRRGASVVPDSLDFVMCRSTPDKEAGASETVSGMEAIEGFVVGLYCEAFQAVVSLINR